MNRSAHVTSVEAVTDFRAALQKFAADIRDALTSAELEIRRVVEWIENDRTRYWPRQLRRALDAVGEARTDLERCQLSIRTGDRRPCYEQKKALENAKRRLRTCEEKVETVRTWRRALHQESEEFRGQLARMAQFADQDVLRADSALQRMIKALDKYSERGSSTARQQVETPRSDHIDDSQPHDQSSLLERPIKKPESQP